MCIIQYSPFWFVSEIFVNYDFGNEIINISEVRN